MKKKLADQGIPFDEQKPSPEEIQEAKAQNKPIVGRLTEDRIRRLNELGLFGRFVTIGQNTTKN